VSLSGVIIAAVSGKDAVSEYTHHSGRMQALPNWTQGGAVVAVQGGEVHVIEVIERLLSWNVPISGVW
jgi:alpha-glucosidase (family GH31 glycosyl hydrolase)